MKATKEFSIKFAVEAGIVMEIILILIQFIFLIFYTLAHPGTDFAFTSEFMTSRGFYIFLILGFFLYCFVTFYLIKYYQVKNILSILIFITTGGLIEVLFYIFTRADYQIAYIFSVMDKFIAALFGIILYFCSIHR